MLTIILIILASFSLGFCVSWIINNIIFYEAKETLKEIAKELERRINKSKDNNG